MRVSGTIGAITLHDINKAHGRHTFNVELRLERIGEAPLAIRVDKVHWERLTAAERAELTPAPARTVSLKGYAGWVVGQTVSLEVELTSPGLAHLLR